MIKKLLGFAVVVIAAVTLVGCGGKPKIPANTIAAGYVDLEKMADNAEDVAKMIVAKLPKEMRKDVEKELVKAIETYEKNYEQFDFEWAAVTVGKGKSGLDDVEVALVVKCDYNEKGGVGTLRDILKSELGARVETLDGCDALICDKAIIAFVDKKYVIASPEVDVVHKMIALYKDGEGETSDAFDDLTDISGDTVLRFQTADVETLVNLYEVRDFMENLGRNCDDEDLVEDILSIGNLTFDVMFSDDTVGCRLEIDAGSKDFARCLEGLCLCGKLSSRLTADAFVGFSSYATLFRDMMPYELRKGSKMIEGVDRESAKKFGQMLRDALEVDRSGSTVEVSYEVDAEDLVELIVPLVTNHL